MNQIVNAVHVLKISLNVFVQLQSVFVKVTAHVVTVRKLHVSALPLPAANVRIDN